MSTSTFDYGSAEAWEASTDTLLPVGDHAITIKDPAVTDTNNGNPQIELRVENGQGSLRDWIVITPKTVGKVAQLFDAARAERPAEGEFDPETGRLTDACVARLHDKQAGVVVREEPDYKDPTRMRKRIQGYVDVSQVDADAPADTSGLPQLGHQVEGEQEKIPF